MVVVPPFEAFKRDGPALVEAVVRRPQLLLTRRAVA
jgi:hypothetical protein